MKKLGLTCLAMVLVLGALGVGYAAWTDTIVIDGTVNTGDLDINAVYFSNTEIWKDLDTDAYVWYHFYTNAQGDVLGYYYGSLPPTNGELVSYAYTSPGATDDTVDVTVSGAFPSGHDDYLYADVVVYCGGTVPVKLDATIASPDAWLEDLWNGGTYAGFWGYPLTAAPDPALGPTAGEWDYYNPIYFPYQMHPGDYAIFYMWLDIPQDNAYMDLEGGFTVTLDAVQFDEY